MQCAQSCCQFVTMEACLSPSWVHVWKGLFYTVLWTPAAQTLVVTLRDAGPMTLGKKREIAQNRHFFPRFCVIWGDFALFLIFYRDFRRFWTRFPEFCKIYHIIVQFWAILGYFRCFWVILCFSVRLLAILTILGDLPLFPQCHGAWTTNFTCYYDEFHRQIIVVQ